jgi:hypothetical protein
MLQSASYYLKLSTHQESIMPRIAPSQQLVLVVLLFFAGLIAVIGIPPAVDKVQFAMGMAVMIGLTGAVLLAGWYLIARPLPVGYTSTLPNIITPKQRLVMALLLIVSLTFYAVGIVWDEVWHIKYGIPFGEDFYWRPHQLIYSGLLVIMLLGGLSWWLLLRYGKGTLAQRFHAAPMLGVLALNSVLFAYAIPADPLWHEIYGEDLLAISVPHVLVVLLAVIGLLTGIGLITTRAKNDWRPLWRITLWDMLPVFGFSSISLLLTALLTADWFGLSPELVQERTAYIFSRPTWALPFLLAFCGIWVGTLAVRNTRLLGAATLVGLVAIAIRLALVHALNHIHLNPYPWTIQLPLIIAIDCVHIWRSKRLDWWHIAVASIAIGSITTLPLINVFFGFPQITQSNVIAMWLAFAAGAIVASWFGMFVGDALVANDEQSMLAESAPVQVVFVVLLAAIGFAIWFVATAHPPI